MSWWLAAVATTALLLAAAKAHGRQVRLEREQQGVFHVDFGGSNPAVVEAIWRRDRRLLWPCAALLAVAGGGAALLAGDAVLAAFAFPWALAAAFAAAGGASWVRAARQRKGPEPWRRRALRGSLAWWGAVAAAAALTLLAWRV